MSLSSRVFLLFLLLPASLLTRGVLGHPPFVPDNVLEAGPAAQFLWAKIRRGQFYLGLPAPYHLEQDAWRHVLKTQGKGIINSYYPNPDLSDANNGYARRSLLDALLSLDYQNPTYVWMRAYHKKEVGRRIVLAFADHQIERARAAEAAQDRDRVHDAAQTLIEMRSQAHLRGPAKSQDRADLREQAEQRAQEEIRTQVLLQDQDQFRAPARVRAEAGAARAQAAQAQVADSQVAHQRAIEQQEWGNTLTLWKGS